MAFTLRPSAPCLALLCVSLLVLPHADAESRPASVPERGNRSETSDAPSTSRPEPPLDIAGEPPLDIAGEPPLGAAWARLSGPAEVWPPGWRREGGVWKRTDGTPLPVSDPGQTINDLIRRQQTLEAEGQGTWLLATLLRFLRGLDPVTLASAQISAFCLLAYRVLRRE